MRLARIALILVIAALVNHPQCAQAEPTPTPTAAAPALPTLRPATFAGVTPCADCPGIRLTVTLRSDGTYTLKRVYLERKGVFEESGSWSYDAQHARLTLFPGKGNPELFSVTFSAQLHMLDADGNPLPSRMNSTLDQVETTVTTLASTGWTLAELGGKPFASSEQHPVTLQFDALGERAFGSGGCNRYTGGYKQEGNKLSFGALASTKMMCSNMSQEDEFFAMLAKVASFTRDGAWLILYDKGGAALARFSAM